MEKLKCNNNNNLSICTRTQCQIIILKMANHKNIINNLKIILLTNINKLSIQLFINFSNLNLFPNKYDIHKLNLLQMHFRFVFKLTFQQTFQPTQEEKVNLLPMGGTPGPRGGKNSGGP